MRNDVPRSISRWTQIDGVGDRIEDLSGRYHYRILRTLLEEESLNGIMKERLSSLGYEDDLPNSPPLL